MSVMSSFVWSDVFGGEIVGKLSGYFIQNFLGKTNSILKVSVRYELDNVSFSISSMSF